MLTDDKKIILFGAGSYGHTAINYFGSDKVYCYADNNRAGQMYCGKRVISFDELKRIHEDYIIVLSVRAKIVSEIEEQCRSANIPFFDIRDLESPDDYKSIDEIRQFKNKHKGERCFMIGNGPSLRADDLTTLHKHGEITFACNAIDKIFNYTPWRPKYYMATDGMFYKHFIEMMAETEAECKFFLDLIYIGGDDVAEKKEKLIRGKGKAFFFRHIMVYRHDIVGRFSHDASKALFTGGTVMFPMLQLAIYMGFSEIYLIGVDGNTIPLRNTEAYLAEKRHFYEDNSDFIRHFNLNKEPYSAEEEKIRISNAYLTSEMYARDHGIRIYNATRGGSIEVFERVDFDSLFI